MAFTKYQKAEKTKVVSPKGHETIGKALHKQGKTSMQDLPEGERKAITTELDKTQ